MGAVHRHNLQPVAAHAGGAADSAALISDFVIIRPAFAVVKHGAAESEGHQPLMPHVKYFARHILYPPQTPEKLLIR
jgi:hypothetical protein